MKRLILLATAAAVAAPILPLAAQNTVVVTGSRVDRDSYDQYYDDDQSAIGLTRTADYFVKPIFVIIVP